jgi:hypothetical protein
MKLDATHKVIKLCNYAENTGLLKTGHVSFINMLTVKNWFKCYSTNCKCRTRALLSPLLYEHSEF